MRARLAVELPGFGELFRVLSFEEIGYAAEGRPMVLSASYFRDDLLRFVDQRYRPGQMILSAAGAVDHDAIVREAQAQAGIDHPHVCKVFDAGELGVEYLSADIFEDHVDAVWTVFV